MEFYRRLGFAEKLRGRGLPPDHPTDVAYFTRPTRYEIARLELPPAQDARALIKTLSGSWSAAELPHRCSQMYIEEVLHDEARRHKSVALNFGWRVTGFTDTDDHVESRKPKAPTAVPNAAQPRNSSSVATGRAAPSDASSIFITTAPRKRIGRS